MNNGENLKGCLIPPSYHRSSNSTTTYTQKNGRHTSTQKPACEFHCIIHKSPKAKTTQMYINQWMGKQNEVYPYNRILLGHEGMKYWYMIQQDEPWKHNKWNQKSSHITLFHLYEMSRIGKSIQTERSVVARGRGWGVTTNRYGFSFGGNKNVLKLALAGVALWVECRPANWKVTSLIPSQSTRLGCRPGSQLGECKRQPINVFLAHRYFSPFLSPSLPLSLKINK